MRINNYSRILTYSWTRVIKPIFRKDINYLGQGKSDIPVDVVIPCVEKDLITLPVTVESLRKFLMHPTKNIYIVAPVTPKLESFCKTTGCVLVNEVKAAPIKKEIIHYVSQGVDRSGWLFQQLIKLNADSFVSTENFLVWDADTALLKPQAYLRDGKYVLNHSDEHHRPYFRIYKRITGERAKSKVSFISHQMVMSKSMLGKLRAFIEKSSGMAWHESILKNLNPEEFSGFSEYELYGNYLNKYHPQSFILEYWFNRTVPRAKLTSLDAAIGRYSRYKTISWHSYNNDGS